MVRGLTSGGLGLARLALRSFGVLTPKSGIRSGQARSGASLRQCHARPLSRPSITTCEIRQLGTMVPSFSPTVTIVGSIFMEPAIQRRKRTKRKGLSSCFIHARAKDPATPLPSPTARFAKAVQGRSLTNCQINREGQLCHADSNRDGVADTPVRDMKSDSMSTR